MNFIRAIQHATIGYGIRRKVWSSNEHCWLYLHNDQLQWAEGNIACSCNLLGKDLSADLIEEDITATDWETI